MLIPTALRRSRPPWLTAPNGVSLGRVAAIPLILVLLAIPDPAARWGAALVFALAAASDALDGYLARHQASSTPLGAALDLMADKLLVAAVLITLVDRQQIAGWAAIVIIARELLVSSIRTYAAGHGVAVPVQWPGKIKTAVTCVAIIAAILALPGASLLMAVAAVLTVVSAWPYLVAGARVMALPAR